MKRFAPTTLCLAAIWTSSALAAGQGTAPAAKPAFDFQPVISKAVNSIIVPAYYALASKADAEVNAFQGLCTEADTDHLATTRQRFRDLIVAWSRVEMYRFGPVRDQNSYERLFFWPDPHGQGLHQIQAILAKQDPDATDVTMLTGKSVAVQGLFALEYVLFGTGSDSLADGSYDNYRCQYGQTVASAIADTARDISDGWEAETGYSYLMLHAGPNEPVYRSDGEVIQELLKSAADQLQLDQQLKLASALGKTPQDANPKIAPFWRSNMTAASVKANLDAVVTLMGPDGVGAVLPDKAKQQGTALVSALGDADKALSAVVQTGKPWTTAVTEPDTRKLLTSSVAALATGVEVMEHGYPDAFGLTPDFSSLDGG